MAISMREPPGQMIQAIYDSVAAPENWRGVLSGLTEAMGLSFAGLVARNASRTRVEGIAVGIDQVDYDNFLKRYFRDSVFAEAPWVAGEVLPTRTVVAPERFRRTQMYQEFHRPRQFEEGLRLSLSDAGGIYRSMSLFRPERGGAYTADELAWCGALMPHLQRAADLSQRLNEADLLATAALSSMDALLHPILLLDSQGILVHANTRGEALLSRNDGLTLRQGRLEAGSAAQTGRLRLLIQQAIGDPAHGVGLGGAMRLQRASKLPLSLLTMPFRHETAWSLGRRPAVLVCLTDPSDSLGMPPAQLRTLFGLTTQQAQLAADLMTGLSLRDIAEGRGRSVHTVRSHLAGLMAKVDVNRQSELMLLLSRLPMLPDEGPDA